MWGWLAIGFTALSVLGYLMQLVLDHVPNPPIVSEITFYGIFAGDGLIGLATGLVAVGTGWRRRDTTPLFGLAAILWVLVVQTIQSLWD